MSIASEITRIKNNIASAYTSVSNKGGTLPETQNSNNLATAISSIPSGGGGDVDEFFNKLMTGTIDQDLEATFSDGGEPVILGLNTNNHNLTLNGNIKISATKYFNVGIGTISLPDTTGQYCQNYFLTGSRAKKVYCPELVRITGSVLFNGAVINYLYLPKLTTIPGNVDFNTTVANKTLYFPSVTQIGTGNFKQAFGNSINYVIVGTANCTLGYSDNIKGINTRGGNIFVPSDSVNDYKAATNWSVYPDIIVGYTDVNVNIGDTITLTGGNSYELTILWYWNTENCATLTGNALSLIDTGDVLIKKFDSNNVCIGGEIYHISEV